MTEIQRCTGHCCKRFYLPHAPEIFKQEYQKYLVWKKDPSKPEPIIKEIDIIGPMLVYIGEGSVDVETNDFTLGKTDDYFYTCKHHDSITGDCKNYENRPEMCYSYPYSGVCVYKGCTFKLCD